MVKLADSSRKSKRSISSSTSAVYPDSVGNRLDLTSATGLAMAPDPVNR